MVFSALFKWHNASQSHTYLDGHHQGFNLNKLLRAYKITLNSLFFTENHFFNKRNATDLDELMAVFYSSSCLQWKACQQLQID